MSQRKCVFCHISRYICTPRIQFPLQNLHVVSFSNNYDVICCLSAVFQFSFQRLLWTTSWLFIQMLMFIKVFYANVNYTQTFIFPVIEDMHITCKFIVNIRRETFCQRQNTKQLKTVFYSLISVKLFNTSHAYIITSAKKFAKYNTRFDGEIMQELMTYLDHYFTGSWRNTEYNSPKLTTIEIISETKLTVSGSFFAKLCASKITIVHSPVSKKTVAIKTSILNLNWTGCVILVKVALIRTAIYNVHLAINSFLLYRCTDRQTGQSSWGIWI